MGVLELLVHTLILEDGTAHDLHLRAIIFTLDESRVVRLRDWVGLDQLGANGQESEKGSEPA